MRKGHICGELDARKITISFSKRSPQVLWAYTFKDVYVIGVRFGRTRAIELEKNKTERKKETKGEEGEQRVRL